MTNRRTLSPTITKATKMPLFRLLLLFLLSLYDYFTSRRVAVETRRRNAKRYSLAGGANGSMIRSCSTAGAGQLANVEIRALETKQLVIGFPGPVGVEASMVFFFI